MNVSVFYDRKLLKRLEAHLLVWDKDWSIKELMRWHRDYLQDEPYPKSDPKDVRPASCKLVCAYGTFDGRTCLQDPLNCIDVHHAGRWHCIMRTYDHGKRTIQVLPL